ncbi:MAG TPA: GNAT family N-acetyltransferase [Thermoanaerobaculia bacterium]|nr:GNAT family N-acetyltransferase [Thermoanaerobaculia bacterium]
MTFADLTIRRITAAETRPIRHAVLRPGRPADEAIFSGDELPSTIHLGAFLGEHLTGVVTLTRVPYPLDGQDRDWQLRGMAVVAEARGRGVGGELIDRAIAEAAREEGRVLWCNGRTTARSFYERHGMEARGEEFERPHTGPHYLFFLELGPVRSEGL